MRRTCGGSAEAMGVARFSGTEVKKNGLKSEFALSRGSGFSGPNCYSLSES